MIRKKLSKAILVEPRFVIGNKIKCVNFDELSVDIIKWLKSKEEHTVRYVYSAYTEPILILNSIEGLEDPKMDGKPYHFMSDRFIKV